jgi:hypothetical protein
MDFEHLDQRDLICIISALEHNTTNTTNRYSTARWWTGSSPSSPNPSPLAPNYGIIQDEMKTGFDI